MKLRLPGRAVALGKYLPVGSEGADVEAGGGGGGGVTAVSLSSAPKPTFWQRHGAEFRELLPYLWPENEPVLRAKCAAAFVCLFASKLANTAGPIVLKLAVDRLTAGQAPLGYVVAYGACRFAANFCGELRDCLFQYVSAHASRLISLKVFTHVQSLSLRFHLNRKTGALLSAVNRGSQAYTDMLRYIAFQILPIFLEVGLASAYLLSMYSWYFGVITLGVIVCYFGFTIVCTEWRNKFRRTMTQKNDEFNQKATDSLLNFETVKYFCAEDHISGVYNDALRMYQKASIESQQSLSLLNLGQSFIISAGVTAAMYLAGEQVLDGRMTIGDFVLVQVYILQLYTPLNFLGTYYRMIKQAFVDVEAMFKLLNEGVEVGDAPGAGDLVVSSQVDVQFDEVRFSYDPKMAPVIKDVSFSVGHGKRVAIVGGSGAGKSTIARLLYRMYDVQGGAVRICNQDISKVTQKSVRMLIGIVPQDCVLFNDSLEYNVAFGKLASGTLAERAEVEAAASAAKLTEFIGRQPQGYDTVVGERGLRLSGGEKQRVAIARALLKDPRIMIYDEATSALDTHTEREIQKSLDAAAKGRTSIAIAHRLSTIMDADTILVLDGGVVVESGTHAELLDAEGAYFALWQQQLEGRASTADLTTLAADAPAAPPASG